MKGSIIQSDTSPEFPNGGITIRIICVDRKVHIEWCDSWYRADDDIASCWESNYEVLGACDCLSDRSIELPTEVFELVDRFLRDGSRFEINNTVLNNHDGSPQWSEYRDLEEGYDEWDYSKDDEDYD